MFCLFTNRQFELYFGKCFFPVLIIMTIFWHSKYLYKDCRPADSYPSLYIWVALGILYQHKFQISICNFSFYTKRYLFFFLQFNSLLKFNMEIICWCTLPTCPPYELNLFNLYSTVSFNHLMLSHCRARDLLKGP